MLPPFLVHGMFALGTLWKSDSATGPGCYIIYDKEGALRYVGMSLSRVGNRVSTHFSASTQQSPFWLLGPAHYIDIVGVFRPWEALSLEGYLIEGTGPSKR